MFSSQHPFQNEGLHKELSTNIFRLFNLAHLSKLSEVCSVWNTFIKDNITNVDEETASKVTSYKKYFSLYYFKGGFLLNINTRDFFRLNRQTYEKELNPQVSAELPFIKTCSDVSFLSMFEMYFWSPDGFNFHLMQEKSGGSDGCDEKIVHFSTSEKVEAVETVCRIKFTPNTAILLEPEVKQRACHVTPMEFIELDDLDSYVPPPPPPELVSFNRCHKKSEELLLQFILSGKINMFSYCNQLKPLFLFHFNENDLLFIGKQGDKTILKIRKDYLWNDLHPTSILIQSNYSQFMHISFNDHPDFQLIKIIDPNTATYQAVIQMKAGNIINLIRMDLNEDSLSKLDFLSSVENPRQTPLDVVEFKRECQHRI